MAKSIIDIKTDYTKLISQFCEYLKRSSREEYSETAFAWFRPKDFEDTTDIKKIVSAFPQEELQKAAEQFMKDASAEAGSDGDYALLAAQHDLLVSVNRSFASRHRSKLRHYAAAAAVQDRVGGEYGTLYYSYTQPLENIKRIASAGN